ITNGLPDRYYRDIAVNPNNANELYITLSGYGTGHVFRSMDAGSNWVDVSESLPDMPFHSVAIDPSNDSIIYVGCDFGVFVSFDKGLSWENFGTGLPEAVMVFDLVFSNSDNMVLAFTHGNGVYRIPQASKPAQVSINNFDDVSITLTPNPVADYLTVNISDGRYTHCAAKILNSRGEVVFQKNDFTLENWMRIYCNQLASGIYFLVLENNQFKHIEKFVKTP
ncbi:MAG TPA: T9SS type A sorting domain-containing protein, partial [Chitinophagales bacterium]|nr:T9SS type A sorting domain-containing protein [Chitinophagales bacterium]